MASTRAMISEPDTAAYSASKAGIVALTHSLGISLEPDVRVNCISLGWIDVSGWKKRSARPPEEVAAALFLCSEEAGFITGGNLLLDGGMTRKMIYAP
ncbi:N-acylmannosamine 1-dehydrogenase [compost metagenome]